MQMRDRLRDLHGHGYNVELRVDALRVRPLMTGDPGFGHQRIHDAAEMAFPRVRGAPQQGSPCTTEQARAFECRQSSDDRGGIAGDDPGRGPPERRGVVYLGGEGVACGIVLLAALQDELDARMLVTLDVLRSE